MCVFRQLVSRLRFFYFGIVSDDLLVVNSLADFFASVFLAMRASINVNNSQFGRPPELESKTNYRENVALFYTHLIILRE
jgi:hypothetical protein